MQKAFGYIRVSGKGQVNGDGPDRQEKAIRDYAAANGFEIEQIYFDEGVSGTKESRPELAKLMVSLEENGHGIKTVVIEKLDRLARDLMVQEAIVRDFQKQGFKLISSVEGADLLCDDPTRKMLRQLFGILAEYDKSMTVEKLRAARERKRARTGKCEGRKGYKDTMEGRNILETLAKYRSAGLTWEQVSEKMNEAGLVTLTGKPWKAIACQQAYKNNLPV